MNVIETGAIVDAVVGPGVTTPDELVEKGVALRVAYGAKVAVVVVVVLVARMQPPLVLALELVV
jgi:hypothetical protein